MAIYFDLFFVEPGRQSLNRYGSSWQFLEMRGASVPARRHGES
jgi:hypothetical protein